MGTAWGHGAQESGGRSEAVALGGRVSRGRSGNSDWLRAGPRGSGASERGEQTGLPGRHRSPRWAGRGLGALLEPDGGRGPGAGAASCVFSVSAAAVLVVKVPVLGAPRVVNLQVTLRTPRPLTLRVAGRWEPSGRRLCS